MESTTERSIRIYKWTVRYGALVGVTLFVLAFVLLYIPQVDTSGMPSPDGTAKFIISMILYRNYILELTGAFLAIGYSIWVYNYIPPPIEEFIVTTALGQANPRTQFIRAFGRKFKIKYNNSEYIEIFCRNQESESGEWFVFKLSSSEIQNSELKEIAYRNGFSVVNNRITGWCSKDELPLKLLLMQRAVRQATAAS